MASTGVCLRAARIGFVALVLNAATASALAQNASTGQSAAEPVLAGSAAADHSPAKESAAEQAVAQVGFERRPGVHPGDPARGGALAADRQRGLCLLCHSAPVGDPYQQGNLAPPLAGVGSRLDAASLRLRIHDSRRINPESLMPAYGVVDPAQRVAPAWRGKAIFSPQQVEDVVAWLLTLQ